MGQNKTLEGENVKMRKIVGSALLGALAFGTPGCGNWEREKSATIAGYEVSLYKHTGSGEGLVFVNECGKSLACFIDSDFDGAVEGPLGMREYPWENPREFVQGLYDMLQGNYDLSSGNSLD